MFVDGMFYTVVAKNLANGHGTFWNLFYSHSGFGGLDGFHEHPPLVFGIQSLFFKIFGNGMYTERIYILCTLIASCFLIHAIWKKIVPPDNAEGWLPLIFWIITPLVYWSFANNMQENTMGVFVLLAVFFYLRALEPGAKEFLNLLFCAVSIFLAAFSKGIPGFFPLALPVLYWLSLQRISLSRMIFQSMTLIFTVAIICTVLFIIPISRESLSVYIFRRLAYRIGNNPTVDSNFWILYRLFIDLVPALLLLALILFVQRMKGNVRIKKENVPYSAFFILTGLAGTLP